MHIRLAQTSEAQRIVALYQEFDRPPDLPLPAGRAETLFAAIVRAGQVAVAEHEGEIVGSYCLYICPNLSRGGRPFGVIENVIVAAGSRRTGVGKALMAHAQECAIAADCYKLMLSTGCMSMENHLFYMACGFVGDNMGFQIKYD